MADSIDAFWPERLDSFEGKKLKSVTQAGEELGKDADAPGHLALARGDEGRRWGLDVSDVRATARLTDSAVVLAAGERGRTCRCSG